MLHNVGEADSNVNIDGLLVGLEQGVPVDKRHPFAIEGTNKNQNLVLTTGGIKLRAMM